MSYVFLLAFFFHCGSLLLCWPYNFSFSHFQFFFQRNSSLLRLCFFISHSGLFSVIDVRVIVMWHLTSTYMWTNVRTVTWWLNFLPSIRCHFLTHGAAPNQEVEKWNNFNVWLCFCRINKLLTHCGQKSAELVFHRNTMAVGSVLMFCTSSSLV